VEDHALVAHRGGAADAAAATIMARVAFDESHASLRFTYRLRGAVAELSVPPRASAGRAERLWEHTCFEAFVAPSGGNRYYELNFSPSTEWAAYEFDAYRQGMRPRALEVPPSVAVVATAGELSVTADVELRGISNAPWPWRIGLAAVVEARTGGRAYFALRHPRENPDFHDAASFLVTLDGSAR
jgi:hypothetical protein